MTTTTLLPAADRVARPWKDGGGITREIAAFPPGSTVDNFQWRISTAVVESAGPFSRFPEIDRTLVVLSGALSLHIDGDEARLLTVTTPPFSFDGDAGCFGTPIDGAVHDLNVMVRRSCFTAEVRRAANEQITVGGETCLVVAPDTAVVTIAENHYDLGTLDALSVENGSMITVTGRVFVITLHKKEIR